MGYSGFRTLFIDPEGRPALGESNMHLPGTLTALCHVREVELQPAGSNVLRWQRAESTDAINIDDAAELAGHLANGTLCNLMLHTNPEAWPADNAAAPPFRCVNGEIFLDGSNMAAQGTAIQELFDALPLDAPTGATPQSGAMSVHASGLSLHADVALPWQEDQPLTAPFLVAQVFPDADAAGTAGGFRIAVEHERLTQTEAENLSAAWMKLSQALNPTFPQNNPPLETATPRWMTLEISNPNHPPRIFWHESSWSALSDPGIPLRYERGEFALLLSDQQPYNTKFPPTSLATVIPESVLMLKTPDAIHDIEILVNPADNPTDGATTAEDAAIEGLIYSGTFVAAETSAHINAWLESISLEAQQLAFNPIDIARRVRRHQGTATPSWDKGANLPVEPATLWGFMPMHDGWAQLPIPNLTEQIYIDAGLARQLDPDALPPPSLRGAAVWGNVDQDVLNAHVDETPWSLAVIDTTHVSGTWKLGAPPADESAVRRFALIDVMVQLKEPEVVVNGLFWLSTGRPTVQDALPDLDNWVSGLMSVPLRTVDLATVVFEPVITLDVSEIHLIARLAATDDIPGSAQLSTWSASYGMKEALMAKKIEAGVLPANFFDAYPALLWRRHAHIPMIQALPLTQAQHPPNYPSASRQLAPFALPLQERTVTVVNSSGTSVDVTFQAPERWHFGVTDADVNNPVNSATRWPAYLEATGGTTAPANEWQLQHDLPLVALSLPGLLMDPRAPALSFAEGDGAALPGLQIQFRHDLPVTDEIQALSRNTGDQVGSEAQTDPRPLTRERLANHWLELAKKGNLAAADAVDALSSDAAEQLLLQYLVEPFVWPIDAGVHLEVYPGHVTLNNAGENLADGLLLQEETALEGITARFGKNDTDELERNETGGGFDLTAGSMAAVLEGEALRDQRGLARIARADSRFRGQMLEFEASPGEKVLYEILSMNQAVSLDLLAGTWHFWVRDLPLVYDPGFSLFDRTQTRSAFAEDVNDPEAHSRSRNFLNGYEWRLEQEGVEGRLKLFNLDFYPLSLDRLMFEGGSTITQLEITGRLQLPLPGSQELTDFSNAVRLIFSFGGADGNTPTLNRIELVERPAFTEELPGTLSIAAENTPFSVTWIGPLADEEREALLDLPGDGAFKAALRELMSMVGRTESVATDQSFTVSFLPDPRGDWPLALEEGENSKAPHLFWDAITLRRRDDGDAELVLGAVDEADPSVISRPPRLRFAYFDEVWTLECDPIILPSRPDYLSTIYTFSAVDNTSLIPPVRPDHVELNLDLASTASQHRVLFALDTTLGEQATVLPFTGRVTFPVLGRPDEQVEWHSANLFTPKSTAAPSLSTEGLALSLSAGRENDPGVLFNKNALEVKWKSYAMSDESAGYFLPGMELAQEMGAQETPGFVCLTFKAIRPARALDQIETIPELTLQNAFAEALIACQWGDESNDFASSGGALTLGYTLTFDAGRDDATAGTWIPSLVMNGFMNITNLISSPHATKDAEGNFRRPGIGNDNDLSHTRHHIRVMFNQHLMPTEILQGASDAGLVFDFAEGQSWQFLAVVEHQLLDIHMADEEERTDNDRRWTALQEVRLFGSDTALLHLNDMEGHAGLAPAREPSVLQAGAFGSLRPLVREALIEAVTETMEVSNFLIVEASAPHWIRKQPVIDTDMTPLQFLPQGSQEALLSAPDDFLPSVDPAAPQWLLFNTLFLGRLQDDSAGRTDAFQLDPVLQARDNRERALTLALALAGWDPVEDVPFTIAAMDLSAGRSWLRLDPNALQENWFRLQHPLSEDPFDTLPSVTAALPDTPARLSRAKALRYAVHALRPAYPPTGLSDAQEASLPGMNIIGNRLVWRQDQLFAPQAVGLSADDAGRPDGWQLFGAQLQESMPGSSSDTVRRFAAATLLPLPPDTDTASAAPSLVLTVSPYLGLGFKPAGSVVNLRVVSAELLCQDRNTGVLQPIASQYWELSEDETKSTLKTHIQRWARETHRRLAHESPMAVLRFREINAGDGNPEEAAVTATYNFALVSGLSEDISLLQRLFSMRTSTPNLRFREGQFGGFQIPEGIRNFELAAPQVHGVQPIYLKERPGDSASWPWGLSTMRMSVRYTEGEKAVIGAALEGENPEVTLWWQAIQQLVQFRAAETSASDAPTAGLPALFRARAIRSLLAALPDPPMPFIHSDTIFNASAASTFERWQPVLPGGYNHMEIGARAGVMQAVRNTLIRQSGLLPRSEGTSKGRIMTSGSVPVQHRTPRPVPLPFIDVNRKEVALQTWASFFEPTDTVLAVASPVDESFFAGNGGQPARRLRMEIASPERGAIETEFDGQLDFLLTSEAPLSEWILEELIITDGSISAAYPVHDITGEQETFSLDPAQHDKLRTLLSSKAPGQIVQVKAKVKVNKDPEPDDGFSQTLTFSLRVVDPQALRLPLTPRFIHFEDPEYNRRLASSAAQAVKPALELIPSNIDDEPPSEVEHPVVLAADRKTYNADSVLSFRYDWPDTSANNTFKGSASYALHIISPGGATRTPLSGVAITEGFLERVSLFDLSVNGQAVTLNPGDAIEIELILIPDAFSDIAGGFKVNNQGSTEVAISLKLDIVREPVTPVTSAGYALLRQDQAGSTKYVMCTRFAWGPAASRVELVNPEDLRKEIVRRRAVFQWSDAVRPGSAIGYKLQKITPTGSTHVPLFEEPA